MTIKIYEALDIINIHVSEGVKIAPNELYRIDEKYIKLDDLRETDKLSSEKLQEQLNTAKKALKEIAEFEPKKSAHKYWPDWHSIMMATASEALAEIGATE